MDPALASFVLEHAGLLGDLIDALAAGVNEELLRKTIRDAMVAASDDEMARELE